jgi:hypothetical protein
MDGTVFIVQSEGARRVVVSCLVPNTYIENELESSEYDPLSASHWLPHVS